MLRYDVYAQVNGVDYQLVDKPFEVSYSIGDNVDIVSAPGVLILGKDYTFAPSLGGRKAYFRFLRPQKECYFRVCNLMEPRLVNFSYKFDVVTCIGIDPYNEILERTVAQNTHMQSCIETMMLMYHKMCQMLVELDNVVETTNECHREEKRLRNDDDIVRVEQPKRIRRDV